MVKFVTPKKRDIQGVWYVNTFLTVGHKKFWMYLLNRQSTENA